MAAAGDMGLERCRPAAVELQSPDHGERMRRIQCRPSSATGLELSVCPDISGGETRASLESLQL
jgi:hypothetical protein